MQSGAGGEGREGESGPLAIVHQGPWGAAEHFTNLVLQRLGRLWEAIKVQGDAFFHSNIVQFCRQLSFSNARL